MFAFFVTKRERALCLCVQITFKPLQPISGQAATSSGYLRQSTQIFSTLRSLSTAYHVVIRWTFRSPKSFSCPSTSPSDHWRQLSNSNIRDKIIGDYLGPLLSWLLCLYVYLFFNMSLYMPHMLLFMGANCIYIFWIYVSVQQEGEKKYNCTSFLGKKCWKPISFNFHVTSLLSRSKANLNNLYNFLTNARIKCQRLNSHYWTDGL